MSNQKYPPNKISSYFYSQIPILVIITITGILYNVGMAALPWFEGKLAQYLCDIILNQRAAFDMFILVMAYFICVIFVQGFRYFKRYYVRKFANTISLNMKNTIYENLLMQSKIKLDDEGAGSFMTKALLDVDACSEGIRKFTTEIFDTGVVMISYFMMLVHYDFKLTLIVIFFPSIAYFLAEKLKKRVVMSTLNAKKSSERLNNATLDRIQNALSYRVYGLENQQNKKYDTYLDDYEKKSIYSNLWESTMQPLYQVIGMISVIFILYIGSKNVMNQGWNDWDIAAFSTYLSCFMKLAIKSSKSAKLFNSVQKAQVSWKRIKPYLSNNRMNNKEKVIIHDIKVNHLSFHYPNGKYIFEDVNFHIKQGQIIGITGEIACGKSTLGKVFLQEYPYEGEILLNDQNLSFYRDKIYMSYLGHDAELISGSIKDNICMGENKDPWPYLEMVSLDKEISQMPKGINTSITDNNISLSGGQQKRLALCRTLYHHCSFIILDDPFSAVDLKTEKEIMEQLRINFKDCIILLISHRLTLFDELDGIIWLENKKATFSSHDMLMKNSRTYRHLFEVQKGGHKHEI
ncbi:MAG: ABC transporter ATP-binding protein [Traorella sp.]